jgi:hypothetical protein
MRSGTAVRAQLQSGAFRGSEAVKAGLVTVRQLRGRDFQQVRHGLYARASVPRDHRLACQTALLTLPEGVVFAGPSAASLAGLKRLATFDSTVYVNIPRAAGRVKPPRGIEVHRRTLSPDEIVDDALPRSVPARAAWEAGAWLPLPQALVIIDAMLHEGLVTPAALAAVADASTGRGRRPAARALAFAEGCVASEAESYVRGLVLMLGFPCPVLGQRIAVADEDAGTAELEPYMEWPDQGVALVGDDEWPGAYLRAGWRVVRASPEQMGGDPLGVVRRIEDALVRSGCRREATSERHARCAREGGA